MKVIELTRGKVAIVDDEDFEHLAQWRWFCTAKGYAVRTSYLDPPNWKKTKTVWMHREICKVRDGFEVDHRNGNKLDNRRCNLREATDQEQVWNRGANKTNRLGVKGINFRPPQGDKPKTTGAFEVRIGLNGKNKNIGSFRTLEEAKAAYNRAAIELRGSFARLN